MKWKFAVFAAVALAPAGSGLGAQTPVSEVEFLKALEIGRPASVGLLDDLAAAEAAAIRAAVLADPRIGIRQERPSENPRLTSWELEWTPPLDGRRSLGRDAAAAGIEAAKERFRGERLRLRTELRRLFAEWELAVERRAVHLRNLERVEPLAARARRRADQGEESGLVAGRLELAAAEARALAARAEAKLSAAEAAARAWRTDLPDDALPTRPELPPIPESLTAEARPDLLARRRELEQAAAEKQLAGRFVEFPALSLGWQRIEESDRARSGATFGLSWTVPLFDRGTAARREAELRRDSAEARLSLAVDASAAQLRGALAAYRTLSDAARRAGAAEAANERLLEAASAAFDAGEATVTDLLDTLRATLEARLREIELYGDALEAHRDLEAAAPPLPQKEEHR